MYVLPNFKHKSGLIAALEKGERVIAFQPNLLFPSANTTDGEVSIEGPHSPEPHTWYARARLLNGIVEEVI